MLRGATALVTASRDEGFGIPLVEAMGLGTPVVASDIPVFREVGGDAVRYVGARRRRRLRARGPRAGRPGRVGSARSAASRERAAHYSWEASARVLLALLERVARDR